MLSITED